MHVLLINPSTPAYMPNKEFMFSTALLSLAAVLQQAGFTVELLDLNTYKPWALPPAAAEATIAAAISGRIRESRPSLIGIGCLFSGQFPGVLRDAHTCKQANPSIPVVVGGMHPTTFPREILVNCPAIDYVVIGEGERQIVAIARWVQHRRADLAQVDGIAWRDAAGEVVVNEKKTYIDDLDSLPLPAYELMRFSDYDHDTTHWHNPRRHSFSMTVPLVSSRSCPMRCNFCSMFLVMGPRIRFRSPVHLVDEIEHLYREYGQRHFSFMDDNVNLKKRHILSICDEILRRGLEIQFETPNGLMTNALDREVMDGMIAAGWIRGAIAIESGSDHIRNTIMGKRLSREKIFEVIALARSYPRLYFKAYFIIGMPEDTRDTLQQTYDMIREIEIDDPYVTNLIPFPGTRVFEQARRDNLFVEDFDFQNLWRMDGFHYHDNKRFYIRPYQLRLEELQEFRRAFDRLLLENRAARRRERAAALEARCSPPAAFADLG